MKSANLLTTAARFLARVPKNEKFFSTPAKGAFRSLRMVAAPNFGRYGNRARLALQGSVLYDGIKSIQAANEDVQNRTRKLERVIPNQQAANAVHHLGENPTVTALTSLSPKLWQSQFPEMSKPYARVTRQVANNMLTHTLKKQLNQADDYKLKAYEIAKDVAMPLRRPILKAVNFFTD